MKKIFLSLILTIWVAVAMAQQPVFKIHGKITYQETGAPVAGQAVIISMDSLVNFRHLNKVLTDANGEYTDTLLYSPSLDQSKILVNTFDCRGANVTGIGYIRTGKLEEVVNLSICGNTETKCEALFKFSPNPENPAEVAFYDGSRSLPGAIKINYAWDFGDGGSSSDQNPIHKFIMPGLYKVCLFISSADSGCNGSFCMLVNTGYPDPEPCNADFSWYPGDSTGAKIIFEARPNNSIAESYTWDFGDGTTATGPKVSHLFQDSSTVFKICLSYTDLAADGNSCSAVSCQEVNIYRPSPCQNAFFYQADSAGLGYTFIGWTEDNAVNDWQWDFGDGTTATGQKAWHIFAGNSSRYKVCLTTQKFAADGTACKSTSCQDVYLYFPEPCSNHFEIASADNITFSFTGKVNDNNPAANYYWNFGDGKSATGQQVTHTFRGTKAEMFYNVCLTTLTKTSDSAEVQECKSMSCQLVYPGNNMFCQAEMRAIPDSTGYSFRFDKLSKSNSTFATWDFGDGTKSNEANPIHTYTKPGIYIACLFISDSLNGCQDKTCQEIWVNMIQHDCKASFSAYPVKNASDDAYSFINTSSPGFSNQFWSFGDGAVSDESNPVHTYAGPGIYNVCLTIWDSKSNCKDVFCMDIFYGKQSGDYIIPGVVMAGNSPASKGLVWLIGADNAYYDQVFTDSAGNFNFSKVPDGTFYLYAMLTPASDGFFKYMPTYYPNSLSWFNAAIVKAGEPDAWYPIQLVSSAMESGTNGTATISGFINWEGQIKSPISIPAANVEVVLFDHANVPVAYTFTDSNGYYEFNNLELGNYSLHAEMAGKTTATADINLTENESLVNINFAMNAEAIIALSMSSDKKPGILAGNPYPNPANDFLNIRLNVPSSKTAEIEIIDMQGRVIHTDKTLLQNNNLLQVETGNLSKGIYMLRINIAGYQPVIRRFAK